MQTDRLPFNQRKRQSRTFLFDRALFCAGSSSFTGSGDCRSSAPTSRATPRSRARCTRPETGLPPRLGGIKWFEKPALTYWLLATGYALFGENEFGARFGVAAASTFAALLLYFFGRRARSARFGYLSAAALVTCGLWPGFARGVTCDLSR